MVKNPPASAGDIRDISLIPGSGRSPGGRHGPLLQSTFLENPTDREAWLAIVRGVTKSWDMTKATLHHISSVPLLKCPLAHLLVSTLRLNQTSASSTLETRLVSVP